MSEVFLCPKGQLDNRARSDLRKAGIVVVEVDDPDRCKFIRATETIAADDMLWACLDALCSDSYAGGARAQLTVNLLSVVNAQREPKP